MSTVQIGKFQIERNTAEAAICYLAGRCNYARTVDGHGFSKFDADFGHSLAEKVHRYGSLTPNMHAAVVATKQNGAKRDGLIHKYRKQLEAAEFDVEKILDSQPMQASPAAQQAQQNAMARKQPVLVYAFYRGDSASKLAIKVEQDAGKFAWLPKSQIEMSRHGGELQIKMPKWLAEEKKLDHEVIQQQLELAA
jgi:hypothetical protein